VVVEHGIDAWPALSKWTPAYFRRELGHRLVTVDGQARPISELIDRIEASSPDEPAPYIREVKLADPACPEGRRGFVPEVFPELLADLQPFPTFCRNRLMSHLLPRRLQWPNGLWELLIGGAGARYPTLHVDNMQFHAFLMQIYGEKEVLLLAPDQEPFVYPYAKGLSAIRDPFRFEQDEFPLYAQSRAWRTLLRPGDTLFIPSGWWHATRMPGVSITVTTNTVTSSNWSGFSREFCTSDAPPLMIRLKLAYMTLLGAALSLGEWITRIG
jgi:hypothetical protein